jgi:hypothetical protein
MRRSVVWLLVLAAIVGLAWYIDFSDIFEGWMYELAAHRDVAKAFSDPTSGRIDALLLLVSFFLLTPVALGLLLLGFVFVLIAFLLFAEPIVRLLKLPLWSCVPIVLVGSAAAAYVMRDSWYPQFFYVIRLVAKAGVVFFSTPTPLPR